MQDQDDELVFDSPLEEDIEDLEISENKRHIFTDQGDPEIDSLYGKHKRGKLVIGS